MNTTLCFPLYADFLFCTIENQARMEKEGSLYTYCSSSAAGSGDTLNGLNFGQKIYFEGVGSVFRPTTDDGPPPPPKSPAKKGRGAVPHGGQPPRCQVEGCNVDLSDAKAYYSRHKVCGMHSKSPKVIVAGFEQRFCQQCSRFHQLSEFDQGKRSCRRRLAGHNERRRKAQPGPPVLSPSHFGLFAPSSYDNRSKTGGGFLMSFGDYSNLHATRESLGPHHHHHHHHHHQATSSSMMKYEVPFQNGTSSSSLNPMIAPNLGISSSSSDECYNTRASDSSGALSLLSNQSWTGGSRTAASSTIGIINDFIGNNNDQFGNSAWDFKGSEMRPDLGLAQMSHHHCNNTDDSSRYNGEVGSLAHSQQGNEGQFHGLGVSSSGGYDDSSSVQHINWLL